MTHKPFKGVIFNWNKIYFDKDKASEKYDGEDTGLGYCLEGYRTAEPRLGTYWRTSWVVKHETDEIIETRNSFYQVLGEEGPSRNWLEPS